MIKSAFGIRVDFFKGIRFVKMNKKYPKKEHFFRLWQYFRKKLNENFGIYIIFFMKIIFNDLKNYFIFLNYT